MFVVFFVVFVVLLFLLHVMSTGAYETFSTDRGSEGGSLYQQMLERQRLHREFENYVYEKDKADSLEKTKEAILHVTGKSARCVPFIKGVPCGGVTTPMMNMIHERTLSHIDFENDNEAKRDDLYGASSMCFEIEPDLSNGNGNYGQPELRHPSAGYGDPLGISARHKYGPKELGEPFQALPVPPGQGVQKACQMNPILTPLLDSERVAAEEMFGGETRIEFSHKRISTFDPNTFHLECVILNADG